MTPIVLETRSAFAPYAGHDVRCRAVAMRDGRGPEPRTFATRVEIRIGGRWEPAAAHVWLHDCRLCRDFGRGVLVEFTAEVQEYESADPATGGRLWRYGLGRVRGATAVGPAPLLDMVAELCDVWGWERVADAVERAHQGGG